MKRIIQEEFISNHDVESKIYDLLQNTENQIYISIPRIDNISNIPLYLFKRQYLIILLEYGDDSGNIKIDLITSNFYGKIRSRILEKRLFIFNPLINKQGSILLRKGLDKRIIIQFPRFEILFEKINECKWEMYNTMVVEPEEDIKEYLFINKDDYRLIYL